MNGGYYTARTYEWGAQSHEAYCGQARIAVKYTHIQSALETKKYGKMPSLEHVLPTYPFSCYIHILFGE